MVCSFILTHVQNYKWLNGERPLYNLFKTLQDIQSYLPHKYDWDINPRNQSFVYM